MENETLTTHQEGPRSGHKAAVLALWVAALLLAGHGYLYYRATHPSVAVSEPSSSETELRMRIGSLLAAYRARQARELTAISLTPPVVDPSK